MYGSNSDYVEVAKCVGWLMGQNVYLFNLLYFLLYGLNRVGSLWVILFYFNFLPTVLSRKKSSFRSLSFPEKYI